MSEENKLFEEELKQDEVEEQVTEEIDETTPETEDVVEEASNENENEAPVEQPSSSPESDSVPYHERYYLKYREGKRNTALDLDGTKSFLQEIGFDGFLTIERECGDDPTADIVMAAGFLKTKI